MQIHAAAALLPDGWARDVTIDIAGGQIAAIRTGAPAGHTVQALVPGMTNLHSHAFQRGFAGLTETRGPTPDSFWTWREMMYRFALHLSPDEMQALATLAYVEMAEAGFTRVVEFHYLHHRPDGGTYDDPAEMSLRILAAAGDSGLALTHLPVFYAHAGFGPRPPAADQRRFIHTPDSFHALMERCAAQMQRPEDRLGLAPHSLRAATLAEINTLAQAFPGSPVHIHLAEQVKEVEDCLAHSGARPAELLLDQAPVGPGWCLIHATHLTGPEVAGIAARGAVVGLCPITEANLGDGLFPAPAFLAQGGRFGIGTDSNVAISVAGELALLEYGQRLFRHERNVCSPAGSTGAALFRAALAGGAAAAGAPAAELRVGAPADLVALHDPLALDQPETLLDRWIFGAGVSVAEVWAAGRHIVQGGQHPMRAAARAAAARVLQRLA